MFAGSRRRTRTPSTVSHPARARGAVDTTVTSWPAAWRPLARCPTTISAPPRTSGGYRFDTRQILTLPAPPTLRGRNRGKKGEDLARSEPQPGELRHLRLGRLERREYDPVRLGLAQLTQRPHREAQELAAGLPGEDPDRLQAELPQREIGKLGGLAGAVKGHALDATIREEAQALAQGLPRPTIEVQRVHDVGVAESGLLGEPLRGQYVLQPLPGPGLARELRDFDKAFPGQSLEVKVGQPEGDAQPLRKIPLREGPTLADGGQDLEFTLALALHGDVQKMNTAPAQGSRKKAPAPARSYSVMMDEPEPRN